MVQRKILDFATQHKGALIFAGGIATAVIAKKIIESDFVKDATTDCVAGVMSVRQDAEDRLAEIKADAEAQVEGEEAEEIEEEVPEEEPEEEVEEEEKPKTKKTKKSKKTKK